MKKSHFTAVFMLTCLCGFGMHARAQSVDTVVVSVPFKFVAGGAILPAGKYRVSRVSTGVSQELAISDDNTGGAFLLPLAFDSGPGNQPELSFLHVGGNYLLSRIKTPEGVYTMASRREMVMLGQTTTPALSSSGSH